MYAAAACTSIKGRGVDFSQMVAKQMVASQLVAKWP
jgi:hypothetical protein